MFFMNSVPKRITLSILYRGDRDGIGGKMTKVKMRYLTYQDATITDIQKQKLKKRDVVLIYEAGVSSKLILAMILEPYVRLPKRKGIWVKYIKLNGDEEGMIAFVTIENIAKNVSNRYPEYCI